MKLAILSRAPNSYSTRRSNMAPKRVHSWQWRRNRFVDGEDLFYELGSLFKNAKTVG